MSCATACTDLDAGGSKLSVTVVEDAGRRRAAPSSHGTEPPGAGTAWPRTHLEAIVKVLQNEARWLRKLDRTQALLYRDDLTGLFNSRYLEQALDAELRRAERFGNQFCLMFIDLDGFKPINDIHGHLSGSSVLRQVADVLREAVREVDVPIRYGGDEFVVVLLGATCAKGVLAAERVRRRIEAKEFQLEGGGTARITASIGVAAYPEHGRDCKTLLKMADETMYDSKRAGKNRVSVVGRAVVNKKFSGGPRMVDSLMTAMVAKPPSASKRRIKSTWCACSTPTPTAPCSAARS